MLGNQFLRQYKIKIVNGKQSCKTRKNLYCQ
jgi:hypothetical protein